MLDDEHFSLFPRAVVKIREPSTAARLSGVSVARSWGSREAARSDGGRSVNHAIWLCGQLLSACYLVKKMKRLRHEVYIIIALDPRCHIPSLCCFNGPLVVFVYKQASTNYSFLAQIKHRFQDRLIQ
jgi:hypothetical protein